MAALDPSDDLQMPQSPIYPDLNRPKCARYPAVQYPSNRPQLYPTVDYQDG